MNTTGLRVPHRKNPQEYLNTKMMMPPWMMTAHSVRWSPNKQKRYYPGLVRHKCFFLTFRFFIFPSNFLYGKTGGASIVFIALECLNTGTFLYYPFYCFGQSHVWSEVGDTAGSFMDRLKG